MVFQAFFDTITDEEWELGAAALHLKYDSRLNLLD